MAVLPAMRFLVHLVLAVLLLSNEAQAVSRKPLPPARQSPRPPDLLDRLPLFRETEQHGEHLAAQIPNLEPFSSVLASKTKNGFLATALARVQDFAVPPSKTYFYHVHKGAGTQMLVLARALNVGPVLQWTATSGLSRAKFFHDPKIVGKAPQNFISNEHFLDDPDRMPWNSYRCFLTTARHPIERAYSHFIHLKNDLKDRLKRDDFAGWLEGQPDNFFVRRFCGYSCRNIPRGQLNQTHLNMALENLYRFDVVIDIDHFAEGVAVYSYVVEADSTPLVFAELTRPPSKRKSFLEELTPFELKLATELSSLDFLFYEHALFIAHSLIAELSIVLIEKTTTSTDSQCTDLCCGPCSKNEFYL